MRECPAAGDGVLRAGDAEGAGAPGPCGRKNLLAAAANERLEMGCRIRDQHDHCSAAPLQEPTSCWQERATGESRSSVSKQQDPAHPVDFTVTAGPAGAPCVTLSWSFHNSCRGYQKAGRSRCRSVEQAQAACKSLFWYTRPLLVSRWLKGKDRNCRLKSRTAPDR